MKNLINVFNQSFMIQESLQKWRCKDPEKTVYFYAVSDKRSGWLWRKVLGHKGLRPDSDKAGMGTQGLFVHIAFYTSVGHFFLMDMSHIKIFQPTFRGNRSQNSFLESYYTESSENFRILKYDPKGSDFGPAHPALWQDLSFNSLPNQFILQAQ